MRRRFVPLAVMATTLLALASAATADEPIEFEPTPESLKQYEVPEWFEDAKLGIYFHWAPFSVPAYKSEWYPRWMYGPPGIERNKRFRDLPQHHVDTWGPLDKFGYKDFIPMFQAEKWEPEAWVALFEEAGAKYVVSAAIHHDGFALWDSEHLPFNSAKMGPKRDIVEEFCGAARDAGLKTGVSTHFGRHWCYYTFRPEYDNWDPAYEGLYGARRGDDDPPRPEDEAQWEAVLMELIDEYDPDYIFVDGGIGDGERNFGKPYFRQEFYNVLAHYYNTPTAREDGVVLTYKREFLEEDQAVEDFERKGLDAIRRSSKWQTDEKIAVEGWCCVEGTAFWPTDYLVAALADTVSKNGNLLLNVGPLPDGTIRPEEVKTLQELGAWMKLNGEAIYGTRPWRTFGEGRITKPAADNQPVAGGVVAFSADAVRITKTDDHLYAICTAWPESGAFEIECLGTNALGDGERIVGVELLGCDEPVEWKQTADRFIVKTPAVKPCRHAYVLKITPNVPSLLDVN